MNLAGKLLILVFLSPLIGGANGSSTVGTTITDGLRMNLQDTSLRVVRGLIYRIGLGNSNMVSPLGVGSPQLTSVYLRYELLSRPDFLEVTRSMVKVPVGSIPGYYGYFEDEERWVVSTAFGDWVMLTRASESDEVARIVNSLSH